MFKKKPPQELDLPPIAKSNSQAVSIRGCLATDRLRGGRTATRMICSKWFLKVRESPHDSGLATRNLARHLSSLRHDQPKNVIDARGIAGAVLLKPFEDVRGKTDSHQFLGRTPELGELLIGERRNIGIVDLRNVGAFLPPRYAVQRRLLALSQGLAPDRFGAHADLLPEPRRCG